MTYATETADVSCPYCGERIEIIVDLSVDHQEYIEDCSVCCRPMVITVQTSELGANVQVRHEDE